MIDLHKLEIFALVAREGSFSRAAERLLMTQSGVSQHIHSLEAHFGTPLFERGRRGVTLTPAGERLAEYARAILDLVAEAERTITQPEYLESGQLAIGATPGISVYLLPDWIQDFRSHYPRLTVSLQTDITSQVIASLRAHRLDVGFIEGELDEATAAQVEVMALQEVEQVVIVGRKHAWWGREVIALTDLHGQSLIMRQKHSQSRAWLEQALQQGGVQPRIAAEFDNLESIKRAVMAGACLSVLPDYVVQHERALGSLHTVTIADAPLKRTLKLVWAQDRRFSPVAHAFLRHMGRTFPQLAALG